MTFEPEAFQRCVDLVKSHTVAMHSPYYSKPCSKTCEVCNMDKNLYDLVREHIDLQSRTGPCDVKTGPCACGAWH